MNDDELKEIESDRNPDPITKEPGSHPIGTGVGAAGAGAAGAAIGGAIGGPVGAVAGALVGGIAGGLGGKAVAEQIDPTVEDAYWREHHHNQDYADLDDVHGYERFAPAYRTGYSGYSQFEPGTPFENAEPTLRTSYEADNPPMGWDAARPAAYAAWNRVDTTLRGTHHPGDRDELAGVEEPASTRREEHNQHPFLHM